MQIAGSENFLESDAYIFVSEKSCILGLLNRISLSII